MVELTRASRDRDAWGRIPSWGGGPRAFKRFEVDVSWWLAGEDWRRVSYNVAARFVVRQTGAARARAELFEPEELGGDGPVAEDGEAITPDDPAAGAKRATTAFRGLLGRTAVRPRRSISTTRNCTAAPANASAPEVQEPCGADVPGGRGAASSPSATRKTITV